MILGKFQDLLYSNARKDSRVSLDMAGNGSVIISKAGKIPRFSMKIS